MTIALDEEQKAIVDYVKKGHNVFFSGQAGTGKSVVFRALRESLGHGDDRVLFAATTGLAATAIGGRTLHNLFGVGCARGSAELLAHQVASNDQATARLCACEVLLVDEVSMLSAATFEKLDYVARSVRGKLDLLWGNSGGDGWRLLPASPVANEEDEGRFCFDTPLWQAVFPASHCFMLNTVRMIPICKPSCRGSVLVMWMKCSQLRTLCRPIEASPFNTVDLFGTRMDAMVENHLRLDDFPGDVYTYRSTDTGSLRSLASCQMPRILAVKVGMPVVLVVNLSPVLTNGLRGKVVDIEDGYLVVFFKNHQRLKCVPFVMSVASQRTSLAIDATRRQVPLLPAWASHCTPCAGNEPAQLPCTHAWFLCPWASLYGPVQSNMQRWPESIWVQ